MTDLDLLVARIKAAGVLRAYKVNEVPGSPAGDYAVLGLDPGERSSTRADGRSPNKTHRFTVQLHAKTDAGMDALNRLTEAAFYDKTLTELDGDPYCWRELQVGPTRDPDAGAWLYVLHTYRF